MALGMAMGEGLHPGHIVLDVNPALPAQKGTYAPNYPLISIVAKRLDALRCHLVWT